MRLGLGVSENLPMGQQEELAAEVEQAGFASLWTNEARARDALLVCQAWARRTSALEIGTGVVPLWTRSPAQLAMATATLQEASEGRFLLGLGVSHPATMGSWHGATYRRPVDAAREALAIIDALLSGETSETSGQVFSSNGLSLGVRPLPTKARIYLAAMGPRMLALAGELADGVLLNWASAEEVTRAASRVRAGAAGAEVGRRPGEIDVAAYVRVAVDDDLDAARRALAREVSAYCALPAYADHFRRQGFDVDVIKDAFRNGGADAAADAVPERMLRALGWFGTSRDDPAPMLQRYRAGGLDHLVARVVVVGNDPWRSMRAAIQALQPAAAVLNGA